MVFANIKNADQTVLMSRCCFYNSVLCKRRDNRDNFRDFCIKNLLWAHLLELSQQESSSEKS